MDKKKQGKSSRRNGKVFEKRVREDLEKKGFIVDRWTNNVELYKKYPLKVGSKEMLERELYDKKHDGKIVPAKTKWNNFTKSMMMGSGGFPDFVAFKNNLNLNIIGIECKINGKLDKEEKEKCQWYLKEGVFNGIFIAVKRKEKNRVKIDYRDFERHYDES